jgi:hypothetical protein
LETGTFDYDEESLQITISLGAAALEPVQHAGNARRTTGC